MYLYMILHVHPCKPNTFCDDLHDIIGFVHIDHSNEQLMNDSMKEKK